MPNQLNKYQVSIYYNLMLIWASNPEQRFSQLVQNLQTEFSNRNNKRLHTADDNIDPFYLSDKDFAEFLEDFVEELE